MKKLGSESYNFKDVSKEIRECKRAYSASDEIEATLTNIYKMKSDFYNNYGTSMEKKQLPEKKLIEESFKQNKILFPNLSFKKEDMQNFLILFTREIIMLNKNFEDDLEKWLKVMEGYFATKGEHLEIGEIKELIQNLNNLEYEELSGDKKDFYILALTFTLSSLSEIYFDFKLNDLDTHYWDQGYCPICGLYPHYGMLRESDGKRILECWVCSVKWEFPRISCAYCHNQNQDELGYFTLDENPLCRVHFCKKCNNYIKIFDLRKYGKRKAFLTIHNLATLSHDLMAEREGFKAGSGLEWVNEEELKV